MNLCQQYHESDILNADETVMNYSMPPDQTISITDMPNQKKHKRHLTLLVFSNESVCENYLQLIIGKGKQPRCF